MILRISMSIERSALTRQFSRRELSRFLVEQRPALLSSAGIARFDPRDAGHRRPRQKNITLSAIVAASKPGCRDPAVDNKSNRNVANPVPQEAESKRLV